MDTHGMLSLTELLILALAAARGTQLIVWDSILDGLRARLAMWQADKPDSKVRPFIGALLACIYCTGFHISWIAVLAYRMATDGWPGLWVFGIEAFAVAGAQMLINRWLDSLS